MHLHPNTCGHQQPNPHICFRLGCLLAALHFFVFRLICARGRCRWNYIGVHSVGAANKPKSTAVRWCTSAPPSDPHKKQGMGPWAGHSLRNFTERRIQRSTIDTSSKEQSYKVAPGTFLYVLRRPSIRASRILPLPAGITYYYSVDARLERHFYSVDAKSELLAPVRAGSWPLTRLPGPLLPRPQNHAAGGWFACPGGGHSHTGYYKL